MRRDDLLAVRKDDREESEEPLEVMEEEESAQFLRAQRVIARSKRVARAPRRPPARRKEPEDAVENWDAADPGCECWGDEGLSPR